MVGSEISQRAGLAREPWGFTFAHACGDGMSLLLRRLPPGAANAGMPADRANTPQRRLAALGTRSLQQMQRPEPRACQRLQEPSAQAQRPEALRSLQIAQARSTLCGARRDPCRPHARLRTVPRGRGHNRVDASGAGSLTWAVANQGRPTPEHRKAPSFEGLPGTQHPKQYGLVAFESTRQND